MSNIGLRLRELRNEKGLTQGELAHMLGCTDKAISCYENNKNLEKIYDFQKICQFLHADINYLISGIKNNNGKEITTKEKRILSSYNNLSEFNKKIVDFILEINTDSTSNKLSEIESKKIYRFPFYEQRAAAGIGQFGRDIGYHMEDFIINTIPDNASFALTIIGESMYNEEIGQIKNGSIALINPKFEESILDNKIVVVNFQGEIICKRYIEKENYILFKSDNKQFESENRKSTDDSNCKIIGIVLGIVEDEKFIAVN